MKILIIAAQLVEAVARDEERSGGLLSRSTLRVADEARLELARLRRDHGDLAALKASKKTKRPTNG